MKILRNHLVLLSFFVFVACGDSDDNNAPSLNAVSFSVNTTGLNSEINIYLNGLSIANFSDSSFTGSIELLSSNYELTYTSSTNQLCQTDTNQILINDENADFNIAFNCLNWVDPSSGSDKFSVSSEDAYSQQVAISNNGDAIVVWEQSDGSNFQIFMSEYRNGSWTHPASLSDNISPNGQDAFSPHVAMNNNGDTLIAWVQFDGSTNQIFMSEYRSGSWTHPADLDDSISVDGQYADNAYAALSDGGDALIVWNQSNGNTDQVFMSEYRNDSWTHPADLMAHISPSFNDVNFPKAAINASGESLIAWEQFDGSHNQIFLSEYRGGSWTHPSGASDNISPNGSLASKPEVEINDSGTALIAWIQSDGSHNQVFMSEYINNTWVHPANLTDNISPDGQNTFTQKISLAQNGDAALVWRQSNIANDQIFISEKRSETWTHPADLDDHLSLAGSNATAPDVSMNTTGQTFVTWQQLSGLRQQIFRSEYRNSTWSSPADLNDNISLDSQDALSPKIASDDNGQALIIWEQQSSGSQQIFASEHR